MPELADPTTALAALGLGGDATAADQQDVAMQDAIRQSVLRGDTDGYLRALAEFEVDAGPSPLVFLMNWYHGWQREFEAFVHVLETEEADADDQEDDDDDDATTTLAKVSAETDLEELETEGQEIIRGFGTIALALLDRLAIAEPDAVLDKHGWTLLMQAANSGLRELVDALVARGADVNCAGATTDGTNPLYLAVSSEHTSEAMILLKNGAIASATAVVQQTTPDLDDDEAPAEAEEDCAWLEACRTGQLSVIEEMIALGVDVNFALPGSGDRALHAAVMFEMQDVVDVLVAQEALRVNAKNRSGQTCLFGCSNVELVESLVARGVDPRVRDADGETAYSTARELGDDDVAAFLRPRTE